MRMRGKKGFVSSGITDLYAYAGFILIVIVFFFLLKLDLSVSEEQIDANVQNVTSNIVAAAILNEPLTIDNTTKKGYAWLIEADADPTLRKEVIDELGRFIGTLTTECIDSVIDFSDGTNRRVFNAKQIVACDLRSAQAYELPLSPTRTLRLRVIAR
jgi:hypothetical protein